MTALRDLLIRHEGLRLKPYRDTVGKLTIGVGRNLDDVGISELEALTLLNNDIARVDALLHRTFPWFGGLTESRQLVVASMVFNIGLDGFQEFKRMISAISKQDWESAASEMLASKWARQVGKRAAELAEMMRVG